MRLKPRNIFLIIGAFSVIISFLLFVNAHKIYVIMLSVGLAMSMISLVLIWLKDPIRIKILWTVIAILFALIEQLTEKSAIQQSTRWMIQVNEEMLNNVSSTLISKPSNLILSWNTKKNTLFTVREWQAITNLFQKTDIKLIIKSSSKIYYEVYGMLDARVGFSCSYFESKNDFGTKMRTYILKWNY